MSADLPRDPNDCGHPLFVSEHMTEILKEQNGGELPHYVRVHQKLPATAEFKPLPERGPMLKDVLFCIDESTTIDQTAIDRFMVSLNGKAVNVSGVTVTITRGELGTRRYNADEFKRILEMRSITVPFTKLHEFSGDGYRKLAIKDADGDQNPHKAHLARGAQWKREKGRRR